MPDSEQTRDRRDVLRLATGIVGTIAGVRDIGAGGDDVALLRVARAQFVERVTPPNGAQQRSAMLAEAEEVLRIIDAGISRNVPAGVLPLTWVELELQARLRPYLDL